MTAVVDWEAMWAPYDAQTYAAVLRHISPRDVVLEIGAGDLRLACLLAQRAREVVAIERNPALVPRPEYLPANCRVIIADAREVAFAEGFTTAVLLMRHCAHFALYAAKLRAAGCRRLITNARWRFDPELIDLAAPRQPFAAVGPGWFACICGNTGFVPGPVDRLSAALIEAVHEVEACPACATGWRKEGTLVGGAPIHKLSQ